MIRNFDNIKELYDHLIQESDIIVFSKKTGADNLMDIIKRDFEEYLAFLYLLSGKKNKDDIISYLGMLGIDEKDIDLDKFIEELNLDIDEYVETKPEAIDEIIKIENEQNLMMHLVMKGKIIGSTAHPSLELIELFRHLGDDLGFTGNKILDKYILDVSNYREDTLEEP